MSKINAACTTWREAILEGTMLAVDPASGSAGGGGSNPAYSYWEQGVLKFSGEVPISTAKGSWTRLRSLSAWLGEHFPYVDVLAVEHVSLGRFKNARLISSFGAIVVSVKSRAVIVVPPISWRSYIDKATYQKTDINDAIAIGQCCVHKARGE